MNKACSCCKRVLPLECFNKCSTGKFGRQGYCAECSSIKNKEYQKRRKPRPEYNKKRYQLLKDRKEYKEYQDNYRKVNQDKLRQQAKQYRADHRIELLTARSNQKCREKGIPGLLIMSQWAMMLEYVDYRCIACGCDKNMSIDHVVPVSLYGLNVIDNIQPLCLRCNLKKGARVVDFRTTDFNKFIEQISSE